MSFSNVLTGFLTGFPVMAVVGPIALLLIEAGLERGVRGAYPAALGVTAADSTFALGAALVGVAAVEVLEPVRSWLALAAVVVLVVLAARLVLRIHGQGPPRGMRIVWGLAEHVRAWCARTRY
jgi:threonine/homoserine/homoserine lactone efflux protein